MNKRYFGKAKRFIENLVIGEMGDVAQKNDGYGIIIRVKANNHTPKHAHVLDTNEKPKGKFEITDKAPETIDDVISMRKHEVPEEYKSKIVKWAKGSEEDVNNWKKLQIVWRILHPSK